MDSMAVSFEEVGMAVQALVSDYIDEVDEQVKEDVDAAAKVTESELHGWSGTTPRSAPR